MSTRITAPNYTQIPNIIFDHWMNVLSPAEFKVLLCICRKTFGWSKSSDLISLKQIEKMTGLVRSGICKNLDKLTELGLIKKVKNKTADGDDATNRYTIDVHSVGGGSTQSELGVVHSEDQGVVLSVNTQKKDITKETTTTTTEVVAAVVSDSEKEKKTIEDLTSHLQSHSNELGKDWAISINILWSLAKTYGLYFLIDQVNYMIAKQQKALADEKTSKKKKTNRIDNPLSFLRMACERNWGMSDKRSLTISSTSS